MSQFWDLVQRSVLLLLFHLSILAYVMILNKKFSWKISTEDEFDKIN